jgi:hypothetical protein
MIKNILSVAVFLSSILVTSCQEQELTYEEKIEQTVHTYLDGMFAEEGSIQDYEIDSIQINDITPKIALGLQAVDKNKELQAIIDEAKELKAGYQNKKELGEMYNELGSGNDAFSESNNSSLEELNEAYKAKKELADKMLIEVEALYAKVESADTVSLEYYEVIARGTITSVKNVQKNAIYPFHISKDYKILKEPLELINRQR